MKKLLLFLLLALVGCGPYITSGEVTGKQFVPKHTELRWNFVSESLEHEDVPDQFFITFARVDEKTGEWINRSVSVDRQTYDQYNKGDYISFER